jgi:hypothetical protein
VLSFSDGGVGTDGAAGSKALPSGLGSSQTLASLSDAEANTVCNWLLDVYPETLPGPNQARTPGCVSEPAFGCGLSGGLGWSVLEPADCILNIRQGPCQATLGALQQCVDFYLASRPTGDLCDGMMQACNDFTSAPGCSETFFVPVGQYLPLAPEASCANPWAVGGPDGGEDATAGD